MLNNLPAGLRRVEAWLLILLSLGFAIRLGSIDAQSLWRDEIDAAGLGDPGLRMGDVLAEGGLDRLRATLTQPGFNGPLYFIALQTWAQLAGVSALALRLPSALFGVLAIPLIYVLARRFLRSARLGLIAAWLATISPYFVWYSQEAKMYAEITALALAAIYALRRVVDAEPGRRTWPWWLMVVGATTLGMYSHIYAALLIGVEAALFALWWPRSRRHWRGGAIALAALTLPYLPLVGWQLNLVFTPGDQGFVRYSFDAMLRVMVAGFTYGTAPFDTALDALGIRWSPTAFRADLGPGNWGVWLMSLLVIAGVLLWREAKDRADRIGLAAWALLPAAAIAIVSINRPAFTDRYLIWIGPAVYLLAALGLAEAWRWRKWIGAAAFVLLSATLLISLRAQTTLTLKADFRSAARYVEANYQGEAIVFQIPHGVYTFDYYFGPAFTAIEGPYTKYQDPNGDYYAAEVYEADIAARLQGQRSVWLVATEVEQWDDRHLLEDWLNRHGQAVDRAEFKYVTVVKYALTP